MDFSARLTWSGRAAVASIDFFETAFSAGADDQADLHSQVMTTLLAEVHSWHDDRQRPRR
jgi:hypothetical protein